MDDGLIQARELNNTGYYSHTKEAQSGVTTTWIQLSNLDHPWRREAMLTIGMSSRKKSINGDKMISTTRTKTPAERQLSSSMGCMLSRKTSKRYAFLELAARKSAQRFASTLTLLRLLASSKSLLLPNFPLNPKLVFRLNKVLDATFELRFSKITTDSLFLKYPSTIVRVK